VEILSPSHLLILFAIFLLFFGARKFPELGRGIGEGIRGFKASLSGDSPKSQEDPTRS
jgi:sec-independent protein translocase protein TatA